MYPSRSERFSESESARELIVLKTENGAVPVSHPFSSSVHSPLAPLRMFIREQFLSGEIVLGPGRM